MSTTDCACAPGPGALLTLCLHTCRKQEEEFRQKHAGHDQMHMEMFLILIGTLVVAQVRSRCCSPLDGPLPHTRPLSVCVCVVVRSSPTKPPTPPSPPPNLQIVLTYWRKWYFSSYQTVTLVGMWVFPIIFAVRHVVRCSPRFFGAPPSMPRLSPRSCAPLLSWQCDRFGSSW